MLVFLLSAVVACVFAAATERYRGDRASTWLLWGLCWLTLAAPAMLRYNVGVDYSRFEGYEQLFQLYGEGQQAASGMDIGFVALIRVLWLVSHNAQILFAASAALIVALVVRVARRSPWAPWLVVALFVASGLYFESLNIVRQWIALGFVLNGALAFMPAQQASSEPGRMASLARKLMPNDTLRACVQYALWVGVGALFHASALVCLVLAPLSFVRVGWKSAVVLVGALVGLAFVGEQALAYLVQGTRYARYFLPSEAGYLAPEPRVDTMLTTSCTLVTMLMLYTHHKTYAPHEVHDPRTARWRSLLCWSHIIACALAWSGFFMPAIIDRVLRYFVPFMLLIVPDALMAVRRERLRVAFAFAVLALWLLLVGLRMGISNQYGVLPYQTVLW